MSWRDVLKKVPPPTKNNTVAIPVPAPRFQQVVKKLAPTPLATVAVPPHKKMTVMTSSSSQDDRIYDSLLPSDITKGLGARQTIGGTEFIPVRYTGRWRNFIEKQKNTLREENTGRAPLFSKKDDPILDHINTLFFGDSYARMLGPPPVNMYVVSYPGIPIKSITRSLTKEPKEVDKRRANWIDTHTLSHDAKKKRVYLSFASKIPTRKPNLKKMYFNFEEGVKGNVGMHSFPRVDIFRQMLRFPSSRLSYLMFWFGNAEFQHTFYYDLFHQMMPGVPKGLSDVLEFETRYYGPFVETYVRNSVSAYLRFLETVSKLEPTTVLVVVLLNYSPVKQHEFRHLIPVKNVKSYGTSSILDFIFDDRTRRRLVDFFNLHLTVAITRHISSKQVRLVDVNELIFDYGKGVVKPEFVLDPRDIHLGDPKRNLYKFLVNAVSDTRK